MIDFIKLNRRALLTKFLSILLSFYVVCLIDEYNSQPIRWVFNLVVTIGCQVFITMFLYPLKWSN